jgi:hypothetical protein
MRDPAVNPAVEDAIAGAVRTLQGPVRAGYFKPLRLDPIEVALRRNTRMRVMELSDDILPSEMRALILRRLRGADIPPRRQGRYSGDEFRVRNTIIVGAIKRAKKRGFDYHRNREQKKHKIESACSIVHIALGKLGVHISESRIEGIWDQRAVLT